jgi:hypothetical protein
MMSMPNSLAPILAFSTEKGRRLQFLAEFVGVRAGAVEVEVLADSEHTLFGAAQFAGVDLGPKSNRLPADNELIERAGCLQERGNIREIERLVIAVCRHEGLTPCASSWSG